MKLGKEILFPLAILFALAFAAAAQLPPSSGAPSVGQTAPDFTLPDSAGKPFTLSKFLAEVRAGSPKSTAPAWVLLIFYRGYW